MSNVELSKEAILSTKILQSIYQLNESEYHAVRNYAVGCGYDNAARALRLMWELKLNLLQQGKQS